MDWINVLEASGVFGLGFLAGRAFKKADIAQANGVQDSCIEQVQQLEFKLRLIEEMSQFKSGFLARTSHELRSPLNGLIGAHQLILSDLCDSPEEEREFITQAHESALKLLAMLDEVINISKAEYGTSPLSIQPVSLKAVLEEVYGLTHLIAENRTVKLTIDYPTGDLYVMVDPPGFRQVLLNLISSAIATMQEGFISISVKPTSQFAQIEIEDNRPTEFWRESIDLLKTESNKKTYTPGFQLTLSQTLIELMQGRLELISADETITRMQCSVPIVDEDLH